MDKVELDRIFSRVESGLSDEELDRVAKFVRSTSDGDLQYKGIHILGWAGANAHDDLIASFLERGDDPELPAIAIRALVRWLRNAKPYLGTLKHFLKDDPEGDWSSRQLSALQVAGDAYRQTQDAELLRLIVEFASSDDEVLSEAGTDSLVTALAEDWEHLTPKQRYELRNSADKAELLAQAAGRLVH